MEVTQTHAYNNKTILSGKLELAQLLPVPYDPDMLMTLNHKYSVFADIPPSATPKIRYFGIGIGGRYATSDTALTAAYKPRITDADLYQPIPFRMVPIAQDLTDDERAPYRMRVREIHNGVEYYAYYLKQIEFTEGINLVRVEPNTYTESPYELRSDSLYPVGEKPSTSGTTDATVSEIKATVKAQISFSGAEVLEAIGVLFQGDLRYAVVSEIGLYSGVDLLVEAASASGAPMSYTEAIYTLMMTKQTFLGFDVSHYKNRETRDVIFNSGTTLILSD